MKDEQLRKTWKQDAEGVRKNILDVAMNEFSEFGLAGARIDDIAEKTRTSKRMIYYYFGDKEGLYIASLEAAYAKAAEGMNQLFADDLEPEEAVVGIVRFLFDYHASHAKQVRMVMCENVNQGQFLKKSPFILDLTMNIRRTLINVVERGKAQGVFRKDADGEVLHWQIQAQSFYNVSNRASFSVKFGDSLFSDEGQHRLREGIVDSTLRYLRA